MTLYERAPFLHYGLAYLNPLRTLKIARSRRARSLNEIAHVCVALTFDTEYVPPWGSGSWIRAGPDEITRSGINEIMTVLSEKDILATFLLEGILAKNDPGLVQSLSGKNHEIGYHGFAHESYGGWWRTNTIEQPRILSQVEVEEKISEGKEILRALTGNTPTSFVAPFHLIRKSTLISLARAGFTVDSSIYNHVDGLACPFTINTSERTLLEVPFAVSPHPLWRLKISPFYNTVLDASAKNLNDGMAAIDENQDELCILLTSHPWEFAGSNNSKIAVLKKMIDYYNSIEKLEFVTMKDLPRKLKTPKRTLRI